jgi:beta-glucuronidase
MAQEISGPWYIRFDGEKKKREIPVPASWNEVFQDKRDFLGPAVYSVKFNVPEGFMRGELKIRFGSVNYLATVRVNRYLVGKHEGGSLPFDVSVPAYFLKKSNLLEVEVDGRLSADRVPPGKVPFDEKDCFANKQYPETSFDFFPYCGIHRKVILYCIPPGAIEDITVKTSISGSGGIISICLKCGVKSGAVANFTIKDGNKRYLAGANVRSGAADAAIKIKNAKLWKPGAPFLYEITAELLRNGVIYDSYKLFAGIRNVSVRAGKLLVNNKPVFLKGFGRHEDYPGTGRGFSRKWNNLDFKLMKWAGANSFRTSHYPYDEEQMELADRNGIMVIDETPAVGLFFEKKGLKRREKLCMQYVREMIARDRNHPSVIMWSLANEPHSNRPAAVVFFKKLKKLAVALDGTRPVTVASYLGTHEKSFNFLDVVCVNRYFGWYTQEGRLDLALTGLSDDLDAIYRKFKKPVILTEFGADSLPGKRSKNPEMFSEDYQAAMIKGYLGVAAKKRFMAGTHVWNMCDFKTGQGIHRPGGMNWKGVFTRERKPKLAAFFLHSRWGKKFAG